MKPRKIIALLLSVATAAALLSGCGLNANESFFALADRMGAIKTGSFTMELDLHADKESIENGDFSAYFSAEGGSSSPEDIWDVVTDREDEQAEIGRTPRVSLSDEPVEDFDAKILMEGYSSLPDKQMYVNLKASLDGDDPRAFTGVYVDDHSVAVNVVDAFKFLVTAISSGHLGDELGRDELEIAINLVNALRKDWLVMDLDDLDTDYTMDEFWSAMDDDGAVKELDSILTKALMGAAAETKCISGNKGVLTLSLGEDNCVQFFTSTANYLIEHYDDFESAMESFYKSMDVSDQDCPTKKELKDLAAKIEEEDFSGLDMSWSLQHDKKEGEFTSRIEFAYKGIELRCTITRDEQRSEFKMPKGMSLEDFMTSLTQQLGSILSPNVDPGEDPTWEQPAVNEPPVDRDGTQNDRGTPLADSVPAYTNVLATADSARPMTYIFDGVDLGDEATVAGFGEAVQELLPSYMAYDIDWHTTSLYYSASYERDYDNYVKSALSQYYDYDDPAKVSSRDVEISAHFTRENAVDMAQRLCQVASSLGYQLKEDKIAALAAFLAENNEALVAESDEGLFSSYVYLEGDIGLYVACYGKDNSIMSDEPTSVIRIEEYSLVY